MGSRKPRPPGRRAGLEGLTNYHSRRVPFFRTKANPGTREMVPNVWTQRKAPPKRGQVYGSLRKKVLGLPQLGNSERGDRRTLATGVLPQSNRSGGQPGPTKKARPLA